MNKIKIKVSYKAYDEIENLLKKHPEYNCIKLIYNEGCCRNNISILLDNVNHNFIVDKVDNLHVIYDNILLNNISEIQIVFKNNKFMIKTIKKNNNCNSSCNNCNKYCKNKH